MLSFTAAAQTPPKPLVTQAIDESKVVTLRGTVHPLAQTAFDRGSVPETFAANRMLLMLNRPPEREAALQQFLADAHNPASPGYHKWITPQRFGELFGPADSDILAAENWLSSHGFRVSSVTKAKSLIEFSGTAANVRVAFHTEIHRYTIDGEIHYANAAELAIPEALVPLVRGVSPINNFRPAPAVRSAGKARYFRYTGKATPLFTNPGGSTDFFAIAPEDFATQYDVGPLYEAGVNGTGQVIGILGVSNIDLSLVNDFRQLFGLSNNPTQVVIDGGDPGIDPLPDSALEAYLDVELSGAVAPNDTVNLYISDGSQVQDPLVLAALRAIEDNQASVLSLSVSSCESVLGPSGNQMWAGLWEQAAAQGQTVFVATGDSGSAGCDFAGEQAATQGLAVNGIASTPWNVAVGGTDFFYAGYGSGPSSAAPFWNQTNDSSNGSLKESLPEQPWDEAFGFNILGNAGSISGGGGGASSCVQSTTGTSGQVVCLGGYAKPIWQTGPGIPNDGSRDLPDVSLFAGAGLNLSYYAICASTGDCATTGGSPPQVSLVGGTSASSPAMAGLMALVNQKYGRQGQADFTLYALARAQLGVFHDLTSGTNNVPCLQGTSDCSLDTNGDGFYSLQKYAAGPGYDLASGLGSVDANALVTNWNKVSFLPTTTTLALSQSSIVHGTAIAFSANVAASSGSGTPTGDVAIATTSDLPLLKNEAIPLSGGFASQSVGFFPGGTYNVSALYGGDGIFGSSASPPVNLTVTPEPSSIYFLADGPNGIVSNNGSPGSYGARWVFSAEPYGMNGQQLFGLATGAVTFTDGANVQVVPINAQGVAGYMPAAMSVGTHAITLSYSGDASYQPTNAGPFTFTIGKGTPSISILFVVPSVPIGGSLFVSTALVGGPGIPPTGNVTISLGTTSLTVPLVLANEDGGLEAVAMATFTNLQIAGSLSLSVAYAGDSNWTSASAAYPTPIAVGTSARAASTVALSVSPTNIDRSQTTSYTATVQSASATVPAPTGSVFFVVNGQSLPAALVQTGPSTAAASSFSDALSLSNGSNQVLAVYSGDAVYNPSTSAPATVNVSLSTFSLSLGASRVVITSGQSGSVPINLNAIGGLNAPLSLSCASSSASIGCTVNPSTPTVSGPTTATLTINAFNLVTAAGVPSQNNRLFQLFVGAVGLSGVLILFAYQRARPQAPLKVRWALGFCAAALLLFANGCGGGGSVIVPPPPPPPPMKVPAPAGSYSVLVTASANGTIHNVKLLVEVQ
ncbi:MAG TPA: Ig-like domain repeat protein [Candidatus Acidoferrum sp.]|nr:Ig-like domain repeat protein [Candidatus Acidoferrum sp.]